MSKEYLDYWGLTRDPFYLAPDNEMLYLGGQYYECFERLLYAVNTNKGGALLVSQEAGLGKTTILLKLVAEMRENYGDNFRYAFVDHPTLTIGQLMSYISTSLTRKKPRGDKFSNIMTIKDNLTGLKEAGGKAVIIVDEAHMLCERPEVLQELRILLNLTHNREYLFTMVLSGQKPLWDEIKSIPEFWQRLPVKHYLMPLKYEETRDLINFRLNKAGLEEEREIFSREALGSAPDHSCPFRSVPPYRFYLPRPDNRF
jgi:type II secretory pathway predicted ATPase ExeA